VEQITHTLALVNTGVIDHHDADIDTVTVKLFTDGTLWQVQIVEERLMSPYEAELVASAFGDTCNQAIWKACLNLKRFTIYQISGALGIIWGSTPQ
jgi:uncharacterized protein YfkK (UPF0435 family)